MAKINFPDSPSDGDIFGDYIYNDTDGVWNWNVIAPDQAGAQELSSSDVSATTGSPTITTDGAYTVYQFTGSGSITLDKGGLCEMLLVGGGGGTFYYYGAGGGGGGGVLHLENAYLPSGTNTIVVGAGGLGNASGALNNDNGGMGENGLASIVGPYIVPGGGAGAGASPRYSTTNQLGGIDGMRGGSGGGGGGDINNGAGAGGAATPNIGNSGGSGGSRCGGGGGGAGASGTNGGGSSSSPGAGGDGISNSITGTAVVYGGGGAGSGANGETTSGGTGGGGDSLQNGTDGLGGGAGGGYGTAAGKTGGSGVVIVRVLT